MMGDSGRKLVILYTLEILYLFLKKDKLVKTSKGRWLSKKFPNYSGWLFVRVYRGRA